MKINPEKNKELAINFSKNSPDPPSLTLNNKVIERVKTAKLVGVHLSEDLKWTTHIEKTCAKANKRIFILTHLRRAGANASDLLKIYCLLIRPILEYACPIWSTSIPQYLIDNIESIQKRCLKIICPISTYEEAIKTVKLPTE